MARTRWFLKRGTVYKDNPTIPGSDYGGFDLLKWLKKSLDILNVENFDNCCDQDNTTFPVRWNSTNSHLEYWNGTAWVDTTH